MASRRAEFSEYPSNLENAVKSIVALAESDGAVFAFSYDDVSSEIKEEYEQLLEGIEPWGARQTQLYVQVIVDLVVNSVSDRVLKVTLLHSINTAMRRNNFSNFDQLGNATNDPEYGTLITDKLIAILDSDEKSYSKQGALELLAMFAMYNYSWRKRLQSAFGVNEEGKSES